MGWNKWNKGDFYDSWNFIHFSSGKMLIKYFCGWNLSVRNWAKQLFWPSWVSCRLNQVCSYVNFLQFCNNNAISKRNGIKTTEIKNLNIEKIAQEIEINEAIWLHKWLNVISIEFHNDSWKRHYPREKKQMCHSVHKSEWLGKGKKRCDWKERVSMWNTF